MANIHSLCHLDSKIRAFTLIELMVVIAIVGVLSVLSQPILKMFIVKAKQVEAKTMMHVVKGLIASYKAENDTITCADCSLCDTGQPTPAGGTWNLCAFNWLDGTCLHTSLGPISDDCKKMRYEHGFDVKSDIVFAWEWIYADGSTHVSSCKAPSPTWMDTWVTKRCGEVCNYVVVDPVTCHVAVNAKCIPDQNEVCN